MARIFRRKFTSLGLIQKNLDGISEEAWTRHCSATAAEIGVLVIEPSGRVRYVSPSTRNICFGSLAVGEPVPGGSTSDPERSVGDAPSSLRQLQISPPNGGSPSTVVLHPIDLKETSVELYLVYAHTLDSALSRRVESIVAFLSRPASDDICMLIHLDDGTVVQATDAALNVFARHRNAILGNRYCDLVKDPRAHEDRGMELGVTCRRENTICLPDKKQFTSRVDVQKLSIGETVLFLRTYHETAPQAQSLTGAPSSPDITMKRFAGGIAHELNNVLTVMVAAFEELREYADEPATVHEIADEIEAATGRAKSMSHRLLSLSGRDCTRTETIQISERIEHCVKDLQNSLSSQHSLSAVLDTMTASIEMDRLRFDQIIEILVSNACEAMPNGGSILIDVSIKEQADTHTNLATISVSDTGHGIPPETLPHIFDKFFSTRPHGMNAGLGLDTAKEFVESVGGDIFVANSENTGTTISLRLPCSSLEMVASTEEDESCTETNRGHLVIVVDDEESIRKYVRRCLEREGYRVLSARDGREGFELVSHYHQRNQPVSAVVSDMLMPRMGGPEMARKLNEVCPNLPFLFISGYTNERVPDSISADVAFLNKPFAHSALSSTLRRLITNRQPPAMAPRP